MVPVWAEHRGRRWWRICLCRTTRKTCTWAASCRLALLIISPRTHKCFPHPANHSQMLYFMSTTIYHPQGIRNLFQKAAVDLPEYMSQRPRQSVTGFTLPPWKLSFSPNAKVSTEGAHRQISKHSTVSHSAIHKHINLSRIPSDCDPSWGLRQHPQRWL